MKISMVIALDIEEGEQFVEGVLFCRFVFIMSVDDSYYWYICTYIRYKGTCDAMHVLHGDAMQLSYMYIYNLNISSSSSSRNIYITSLWLAFCIKFPVFYV